MGPTPYYNKPPDVPIVIAFSGFTTTLDAAGDYQFLITSHVTGDPDTLGEYEVTKLPTTLTITPRVTTQDFIVTIIPFNQTGPLLSTAALSKRYHAIDIYTQACEDSHASTALLNHNERFMLINRAILAIVGQFYSLVAKDYNTRSELTIVGANGDTEATINVSGLPVMRLGTDARATLEMLLSANGFAERRTEEEYLAFRPGNSRDRSVIIYAAREDEFRLKKGSDVSAWGTAYGWYPRIPLAVSADTDWVDVPDALINLVILKLSMLIRNRVKLPDADIQPAIERVLRVFNGTFGIIVSNEEMTQKVKAAA